MRQIGEMWKDHRTKNPWCVMGNNGRIMRYKLKREALERAEFFKKVQYELHGETLSV